MSLAAEKSESVKRMFGDIAPRYDLLNHLLSLNIDKLWRRRAVRELLRDRASGTGRYLDACAGTLDLSVALATSRYASRGRSYRLRSSRRAACDA